MNEKREASVVDLVEAAIAIMGLFVLVGMITAFETLLSSTTAGAGPEFRSVAIRFAISDFVVRLLVGLGLILKRRQLALMISVERAVPSFRESGLLAILVAATGVFVFTRGLERTLHQATLTLWPFWQGWQNVVPGALQILIGAALFLLSSRVSSLWESLRSARGSE